MALLRSAWSLGGEGSRRIEVFHLQRSALLSPFTYGPFIADKPAVNGASAPSATPEPRELDAGWHSVATHDAYVDGSLRRSRLAGIAQAEQQA